MTDTRRCLITAGPTREHIDPVRYLSNGSSGRMGYALAEAAARRGWHVDLVSGPVALGPPTGVNLIGVQSAAQMLSACEPLFIACDAFIAVAAVADYRPKSAHREKFAKTDGPLTLELEPTPDILRTLARRKRPGQVVVGFAAETERVEENARRKLGEKNLDWIVANRVGIPGTGMESFANTVAVIGADGSQASFGPAPKPEVARFILDRIFGPTTAG